MKEIEMKTRLSVLMVLALLVALFAASVPARTVRTGRIVKRRVP
jgi:hypothetical protein